jgi:hypothetical protein
MTTPIPEIAPEAIFRASVVQRFGEPQKLPSATVATVTAAYPPATYPSSIIEISDGTSLIAISNGSAWLYPDGTPV